MSCFTKKTGHNWSIARCAVFIMKIVHGPVAVDKNG